MKVIHLNCWVIMDMDIHLGFGCWVKFESYLRYFIRAIHLDCLVKMEIHLDYLVFMSMNIRPDNWVIIIIIMEIHLSLKEIHLSLKEIHLSLREIHLSLREIHLTWREIHLSWREIHLSWREIHLSLREIHLLKLGFQDIVLSCTVGFVGILHLINFLFMDDLDIKILGLLYFNKDYLVG